MYVFTTPWGYIQLSGLSNIVYYAGMVFRLRNFCRPLSFCRSQILQTLQLLQTPQLCNFCRFFNFCKLLSFCRLLNLRLFNFCRLQFRQISTSADISTSVDLTSADFLASTDSSDISISQTSQLLETIYMGVFWTFMVPSSHPWLTSRGFLQEPWAHSSLSSHEDKIAKLSSICFCTSQVMRVHFYFPIFVYIYFFIFWNIVLVSYLW